jgi:hypothetical protein
MVAVTASLAALTRASGLVVVGIVGLAVLAAVWRQRRASGLPRRGAALGAVGWGSVVGAAVLASAGWFYLRNLSLYGDLTGASVLFDMFKRSSPGSVLEVVRVRSYWINQAKRFWDSTFDHEITSGSAAHEVWWVGALPTVGFAVFAGRRLWRLWPPGRLGSLLRRDPRFIAAGLLVGMLVLLDAMLAQFISGGGGPHIRYLFPDLAIIALAAAIGLASLPGGRRGLPAIVLLGVALPINLWLLDLQLWALVRPQDGQGAFRTALTAAGLPARPLLVLVPAAVLLAAALALQALALWSLGRRELTPRPAAPEPPMVSEPLALDALPVALEPTS